MSHLFETGKIVIEKLKANGFEAYFVGGSVRDYLMRRDVHDVDITTNALPEEIELIFERTIDVGKEHGTVIVLAEETPFEVTTYRTETTYSDHRRPDEVIFTPHLDEDLKRRDFTMNAMAMTEKYELHDPFDGSEAILKHNIVTVGEADERFDEDALRMLRALRFMSVLGFSLEETVSRAIRKNHESISYVAIERIVVELRKMYAGININGAKSEFVETRLSDNIPFFKMAGCYLLKTKVNDFTDELWLQIHLDPSLKKYMYELKLTNKDKKLINDVTEVIDCLRERLSPVKIAFHYDHEVLRRLHEVNADNHILNVQEVQRLTVALYRIHDLPVYDQRELEINGRSLMTLYNTTGGPWIKEVLRLVLDEVLFERLDNDKKAIEDWVKTHVIIEDGHLKTVE